MKRHLIIFSLLFSMLSAFAQEVTETGVTENKSADTTATSNFCPHRINLYLGGSITNNIFNRLHNDFATTNYSVGSILELKYAYFFNENWGITAGVGIGHYATKANLNIHGVINKFNDPEFAELAQASYPDGEKPTYDLYYNSDNLVEKQKIWAVEIPLQAVYENKFGGRNGIYAALGVKAFIPVAAKSIFDNEGTITTKGYEELYDIMYQDMKYHFGVLDYKSHSVKTKLRASLDFQLDFGGIFGIARNADFYVGVYSSIGVLDILPKGENKVDFITTNESNNGLNINPLMASNYLTEYNRLNENTADFKAVREKWNLFQVGVKVGFHFKPCASNEPSMKDIKKKYYEEMAKKANEPIIIKNTEYVYIVPATPEGYEEDDNLSKADKDNIRALAEALSNTKILFDLDKDIPKITEYNDNIRKTVEILKKDKSLGLIVEGYTCDIGSEAHNRDLAQRRAEAVRNMFITQGVNASQISIAAYTVNDPENKKNIPQAAKEEHRAAIFRIIKK